MVTISYFFREMLIEDVAMQCNVYLSTVLGYICRYYCATLTLACTMVLPCIIRRKGLFIGNRNKYNHNNIKQHV